MIRVPILSMQLGLLLLAIACAGSTTAPALNSERIAARYGSYEVSLLQQEAEWRISSLESRAGGAATTRTLAVVRFALPLPAELRPAHERIVAGASIGATFRDAGWDIEKRHLYGGTYVLDADRHAVLRLMRLTPPAVLAVHAYRFEVVGDAERHAYATIVELHHPDYLALADLRDLYALPAAAGESCAPPSVRAALQRIGGLSESDYTEPQYQQEPCRGPPCTRLR
ncbi:MAG: hypothetical protein U5K76_04090 [Woeseiaceae bacterium]|nr:hypothetical protein [Woeseiaceae bacterium]